MYATGVDVEFSGVPKGAILTFANDVYAGKFIAMNRRLGVVPR